MILVKFLSYLRFEKITGGTVSLSRQRVVNCYSLLFIASGQQFSSTNPYALSSNSLILRIPHNVISNKVNTHSYRVHSTKYTKTVGQYLCTNCWKRLFFHFSLSLIFFSGHPRRLFSSPCSDIGPQNGCGHALGPNSYARAGSPGAKTALTPAVQEGPFSM